MKAGTIRFWFFVVFFFLPPSLTTQSLQTVFIVLGAESPLALERLLNPDGGNTAN